MLKSFIRDEQGMATIEIVVITAVLLALALAFKDTMFEFFGDLIRKVIGVDV